MTLTLTQLRKRERAYRKDVSDAAKEIAHAARYDGPLHELGRLMRALVAATNRLERFTDEHDTELLQARIERNWRGR